MFSKIKSLSKSADDTKLSGAADTPEEWDAVQSDLEKLEKWIYGNLMKLSNDKCKVLHLSQCNPQY